jgi:hypothetical protein
VGGSSSAIAVAAARSCCALVLVFGTRAARADVFSPGPLTAAHAKLEGIRNCTQCHVAGGQLSAARCLDCHAELKERVAKRTGFHGRLSDAERSSCNECHHEHQGRDAVLVDPSLWGLGGKDRFSHKSTGFVLEGKHAQARCDQCHLDRLIADPAVKTLRATHPERATFLGAPTRCAACHFDEHRGQLGPDCRACHVETGWKPAPGFNHAKTDFRLEGKHKTVACLACHVRVGDPAIVKGAFPAPVSAEVSRFKPVAHASCVDCHKDPHEDRFGQSCTSCHTVGGWLQVKSAGGGARAFHDKTRFPLLGAHADVACKSCHGPGPDGPAVFKGLKFSSCADCHVDAHLGQLGKSAAGGASCESCHTVQGFRPARYEASDHKSFALEGAHAAVACSVCHRPDPKLEARASPVRTWLQRRGRKDELVLTSFHPPGNSGTRCDTCHTDPHGGQFADRVRKSGCADCHVVASFAQARFDHAQTRFPLSGRHQGLACASCHVAGAGGAVRYAGLEVTCASCHADPHLGQFASSASGQTDCASCHGDGGFKPSRFEHRPPFTAFALEGRHQQIACAGCHREVAFAGGAHATRFKGLPTSCAGCHVDVHHGAFEGFAP